MSRYKPYPGYKDSAVEWIRSIPEHWAPRKVFHSFVEIGSGTTPPSNQSAWYADVGIPWITTGELRENTIVATAKCVTQEALEAFSTLRIYPAGALAVAMYGATIGRLGILGIPATTNQACCVLAIGKLLDIRYMFYWLQASKQPIIDLYAVGGGQPNINQEVVASLKVPAPNMDEQATIVAALDQDTARIDALVAKKTALIELLKEKRQALITHSITKGLDPTVKMKDSGVEWIGEIPDHWELSKLAYATREAGGKTPDTMNNAYWGGGVPWVSPKDMKRPEISDAIDKITDVAVAECGMKLFEPGTILVVVRGMILAHSFPVAELKVPATINQDMKALEPDSRVRPAFLRLLLETAKNYVVSVLVAEAAHGTRVLRTDVWRQLPALLPPIGEQDQILDELRRVTATHDKLIDKVDRSITLLKERRAALITAAVTGQIDLRAAV